MKKEISIFQEYLKKKGMRQTRERDLILREILASTDHFDVEELYMRLKKKGRVSKASIYRTIPLCIEAGLLTEVFLDNGHMHYEHLGSRGRHSHLRCSECSRVVEFSDPRLDAVAADAAERHGFSAHRHKMEIIGLCPECPQE